MLVGTHWQEVRDTPSEWVGWRCGPSFFFFFFREEDPKDPIFMGNHTFRVSREDLCYDVVVILVLLWVFAIVTGYLVPGQLQPELGSHYSQ